MYQFSTLPPCHPARKGEKRKGERDWPNRSNASSDRSFGPIAMFMPVPTSYRSVSCAVYARPPGSGSQARNSALSISLIPRSVHSTQWIIFIAFTPLLSPEGWRKERGHARQRSVQHGGDGNPTASGLQTQQIALDLRPRLQREAHPHAPLLAEEEEPMRVGGIPRPWVLCNAAGVPGTLHVRGC